MAACWSRLPKPACLAAWAFGARQFVRSAPVRLDAAFFGESPSRFIVSVPSRAMPEMQTLARRHHVEISLIGLAGGDAIEFEGQFKVSLAEMREAWEGFAH